MMRSCGESSTMSRRLFIASIFEAGLVDQHYGNVVANRINTFALDALERVLIRVELNLRFASRTREYFQEFLTDCHRPDLSKRHLRGNAESLSQRRKEVVFVLFDLLTYTFTHVVGIRTAIHLPPPRQLFRAPFARVGAAQQSARKAHHGRRRCAVNRQAAMG